jgi:transcriptional regulator with XRE-family HTH domain
MKKEILYNNIDIPRLFRDYRNSQKITQKRLAVRLGLTQAGVNAYENNGIKPSLDVFLKLLELAGYKIVLEETIN